MSEQLIYYLRWKVPRFCFFDVVSSACIIHKIGPAGVCIRHGQDGTLLRKQEENFDRATPFTSTRYRSGKGCAPTLSKKKKNNKIKK